MISRFFRFFIGLLAIAGLSVVNPLAAAQMSGGVTQSWAVRVEGPTNQSYFQAGGISVGSSGDVFVAGQARPFGASYNHDIVVSRYDSNGVRLWQRTYQPPEGPTADETMGGIAARGTNVYVAATISSSNTQDFLTLKYRNTGQLEWAARLDGDGHSTDRADDVAVDAQGNVLVAGSSVGTNGSFDIVVFKYAPNGALLWKYYYDGPAHESDRAVGIRVSADGSSFVAGTSIPGNQASVVTFKLDANGQQQWVARETSTDLYGVTATSFDVDSAGHVVTFARERLYSVMWKYDGNGNRQWVARYRAEEPASMSAWGVRFDGIGNIIAAANLYGSGTNDAVVIKYAADGQQLWATRFAHPHGVGHLQSFAVDGEGNAYLAAESYPDIVTIKVGTNGSQLWSITYNGGGLFVDWAQFMETAPPADVFVAVRSIYFSDAFVSLVKYSQQPVTGIVTAVVTPALHVVDPGTNVVFTAQTSGPGPVQFQWRRNGRAIPDATNVTLALMNVQVFDRGDFSVVVSNPAGATVSPEARLSVRTPPEVVVTPTQTVAYVGTDTAFLATVSGNDFFTLQWRHNGTNIPGATNDFLQLLNLTGASGGSYDVVASTFGGTTTSSAAGLRISGAVELVGTTPHRSGYLRWDYAPHLRVLTDGEFIIAARSNHLTQGSSILLRKHDAAGGLVWSRLFDPPEFTNAEPSGLALDAAGNIYVMGLSPQQYIGTALAVLKYSPDGQLLWSRILDGTNVWGSIHSFAVDRDGNSALAMLGQGVKVIRYNSAGNVQWTYEDTSPDNDTIAVAVDAFGNSFLGTTIRVGGGSDNEIRVRKFDSAGAILWTLPDADGIYNRLGEIAVDSSGNLIVVGTGELGVPDSWMFVQKYSPAGQKLWETRTGSSWSEIAIVAALAVGPADEITVLTMSDDDYIQEQSGLARISSNGQLRYRIGEPEIILGFAGRRSQLALDQFGNAYVTGSYGQARTAKYDAYGSRLWMVPYSSDFSQWNSGLALGLDAVGDVRVLATEGAGWEAGEDFRVLHFRQRHPAGNFRVRLIPDAAGTFHLSVPTDVSFQIEASTDLQSWSVLGAVETQQLLQPGGTAFSGSPRRFFRLISTE